ncbi:ABC transporter ATP-binding protein [Cereibacter changlensis]|nr:ABC transporter ATP-binding protein [Cereibacter changlensis]PZX50004.1 ABC-type bacteriocin/lantibiotic exporter with double-glycine peptidase domain [Cereibacter changlensis]
MIDTYRKLYTILSGRERKLAVMLTLLALLMGFLDVLGVAAVLPFLAVVSNPDLIQENSWLRMAHGWLGNPEVSTFLIILGFAAFLFVLFAALFRAGSFYALTYFVRMRVPSLSLRLMESYLSQPYTWFLQRHTSDLGKSILSEVAQVVNGPLQAAVNLVAYAVMMAFLVIFLLILEPAAALGAAVLFGGAYGLIYLLVKRPLARMGEELVETNRVKFQIMQEAMGGIKNVKLMNLENSYLERFKDPSYSQAKNQAAYAVISELPRHLLEVIAFGGMILFVLWLLITQGGMIADIVPILGIYAFSAARMFPTLQKLFASVSTIRYGKAALDALCIDLQGSGERDLRKGADLPAVRLREKLELADVSFTFPGTEKPSLSGLWLSIAARTSVGIVGATGAGKTTAVDLILGLLAPASGALRVDGQVIDAHNVRAWQRSVGYVPQDIFLVDDTIAANIAFGLPPEKIDYAAVERAARAASLHAFVSDHLPLGYDTMVGERGTRLSGGQRQRIGIARALYNEPDLLVFDEATSALDNLTERAVIEAVYALGGSKTIIMIAHRLSTVQHCDQILMLENGRVAAAGPYDRLVAEHEGFRALHEGTQRGN